MAESYTKSVDASYFKDNRQEYVINGTVTNFINNTYYPFTDTLNGVKNPSHRAEIRDRRSATTPVSGSRLQSNIESYATCSWAKYRDSDNKLWYSGKAQGAPMSAGPKYIPQAVVAPAATVTDAHNQAVNKLYKQLNYLQSIAKIGEDVGERKQTIDALRRPLPNVQDLLLNSHYKAVSDLDAWKSPVRLAKALADTHIQFAFGWNPLVNSIASSIVSLQNRDIMAMYQPFHARGKATFGGASNQFSNVFYGYLACKFSQTDSSEYSETYQGIWAEECNIPRVSVNRALGLEPRDILPTIWNLIPYSFLFDYFVNIGDIVGSLAVPWQNVKWCNYTTRTRNTRLTHTSYYLNAAAGYHDGFINQTPGVEFNSIVTFSRSKAILQPLPDLEFTKLEKITARQWLNMAALAVSQSASLALKIGKAVKKNPDVEHLFIEELRRRGGYRNPYPFHK